MFVIWSESSAFPQPDRTQTEPKGSREQHRGSVTYEGQHCTLPTNEAHKQVAPKITAAFLSHLTISVSEILSVSQMQSIHNKFGGR